MKTAWIVAGIALVALFVLAARPASASVIPTTTPPPNPFQQPGYGTTQAPAGITPQPVASTPQNAAGQGPAVDPTHTLEAIPVLGGVTVAIVAIGTFLQSLQGGSGAAAGAQLRTWANTIAADRNFAQNFNNASTPSGDAWLRLRCWAGDQTVINAGDTRELFGTGSTSQGCGCATATQCRISARHVLSLLLGVYPFLSVGPLDDGQGTIFPAVPARG